MDPAPCKDIVGGHKGWFDAQAAGHLKHHLGVTVGRVVGEEEETSVFTAAFTKGVEASNLQVLDKVALAGEGKFPDDQLGQGNEESRGLRGDELVGKIGEIQHQPRQSSKTGGCRARNRSAI